MKKSYPFLFLLLLSISSLYAQQQYTIPGTVYDKETKIPLSYASIRVIGTSNGTTSNKNGSYEIRLKEGSYRFVASFIGYISDTVAVQVNGSTARVDISLAPSKIDLQEVVIRPGENPAIRIIRAAIERKHQRNSLLQSYVMEAYTKGAIKTTEDMNAKDNTVSVGISGDDTSDLKISGIIENRSQGYFKRGQGYKEIILARKQTANFPPSVNVLTGGRLVQNFYEETINFFGRNMPAPLADDALDYYYYRIEKMAAIDNKLVYQIYMTPDNSSDPGFEGRIYITDSTFNLIKVDLQINRAANVGGIIDTINVFQQFSSYDSVYMPVDYRIFANANIIGLVRFGFELNTILYNYEINRQIDNDFFDKAIITVLPDADAKDSLYWRGTQTIPSTTEEQEAYKRIDSITAIPRTFWDNFSFLSTRVGISENIAVSGPLSLYHFNRVEGHALDFGIFVNDALKSRLNSDLQISYGFSDKKMKGSFNASYLLGDYRTTKLSFTAYNRLNTLFGSTESYNELTSTLSTLFSKYEFRDYYYSKGLGFGVSSEVFPVLTLHAGFDSYQDNSAQVNTDFSFLNKSKTYRLVQPVNEGTYNIVNAGFTIDFRKYIEDGMFRRRTALANSYIVFEGDIQYSNYDLLKSGLDFTTYTLKASGILRTFRSTALFFRITGMHTDGTLPYQDLYALPGNINAAFQDYSFRTLKLKEGLGEDVITLNLHYTLNDELFKILRVPGLQDWEVLLYTFFNAGFTDIDGQSRSIYPSVIKTFNTPFYEAGFGFGHILFPFFIEFAWKLNHLDGNNFRVGLNAFIF